MAGIPAVGIFNFVASWNAFLDPLISLNDPRLFTLSLGITSFKDLSFTQWSYLMAAALAAVIPCVVVVLLANRLFIQGIVIAGRQI